MAQALRALHHKASAIGRLQKEGEAKILTVQTQEEQPQLWAMVDPAARPERRRFVVYPTGCELVITEGERLDYIGTFQLREGLLVFHLFEIVSNTELSQGLRIQT